MRSVATVRAGVALWEIAVPSRPTRPAGVSMAGFRDQATELVDLRLVPHPAVTLGIDLGSGLIVDDAHGRQQCGTVVAGLAPTARVSGRRIECLQIRVSPIVAHTALRGSPELDGAVITLDDLWGPDARRVQERLREAPTWDARFAIVEDALAQRHAAGRPVDPETRFVWSRMTAHLGRVRVEDLAIEVGWSRKRLWSRFRAQIGMTPKRAAQLIRFNEAARRLAAGHSPALVAADTGYADQSHLHRDVAAFTGVTPTAVAADAWLAVDHIAWP
ncbi:helix-turn-helix domain-containing protein [Kutzneria sp. NPDC051319]|uniref:helix-turn-helix domain-containing protein n=1 Tax=Kutzneria sp. NPDC051319 TaxID=3155047 RepID=UPI00341B1826